MRRLQGIAVGTLMNQIFIGSPDGLVLISPDNVTVEVNPAYERMTGYPRAELIGRPPDWVDSGLTPPSVYTTMRSDLAQKGNWTGELINRRPDGSIWYADFSVTRLLNNHGRLAGFIGFARDVSHVRELQARLERNNAVLRQAAERDAMTGLFNHGYFHARLQQELQRAETEQGLLSVVFVDTDYFKAYNDRYGHPAGDQLLRELAGVIAGAVRAHDVVCRYGGDEFAIILPGAGPEQGRAVCQRILDEVAGHCWSVGREARLTVSAGLAVYPRDSDLAEGLIKAADNALYAAKGAGRNCVAEGCS